MIYVREYRPFVTCDPTPVQVPSVSSCNEVLAYMPVNTKASVFDTETRLDKAVSVLPREFAIGRSIVALSSELSHIRRPNID